MPGTTPPERPAPGGVAERQHLAPSTQHLSLVSEPLPRLLWRFGAPAVASNLLMILFGSVDAYWVGTRIGAAGLAAVSLSLFWIWLVISIAEMVSIGLTAVAARRHGEGQHQEAARVVGEAVVFSVMLGCVIALIGVGALNSLFDVMNAPPEVAALGRRYLGTYLAASPLLFGYFSVDAAFRASGNTRTPLALLGTSVAATLVLDPVLILGLGSAPELGIAGAAIATVCTRSVVFVAGLMLLVRRGLVRFERPRLRSIARISRIGLPTAVTGVLFSLIYVALTPITTRFGTPALAALGLGHRIEAWLYMVGTGFGAAAAAVVGQNLGAGQVARAERAGWVTVGYGSALGVAACVLMLAFPELLAGVFTSDPEVVRETARYLRFSAVSQLFLCAEVTLEGAMGGAGDTVPPMVTSTVLSASRIPLAHWAAPAWGTAGLWGAIAFTAAARGLAMMGLWHLGWWKRKSV